MGTTSGDISSHEKMNTLGYIKQSFCLSKYSVKRWKNQLQACSYLQPTYNSGLATRAEKDLGHQIDKDEQPSETWGKDRRRVADGEREDPKCY